MLDSGVRNGVDIAKAVALGAKAVWIARPYAYAVAADGQAGVESLLSFIMLNWIRAWLILELRVWMA